VPTFPCRSVGKKKAIEVVSSRDPVQRGESVELQMDQTVSNEGACPAQTNVYQRSILQGNVGLEPKAELPVQTGNSGG